MKIKHPSAVDQVFHSLMNLIRNQEPGTRLPPQDVLAKKFYVSRTVLREAISMLLTRNILTVRPKIGTSINPRSEWLVLVPQSTCSEIQEVLKMFTDLYRVPESLDDLRTRAEFLLTKLPNEVQ